MYNPNINNCDASNTCHTTSAFSSINSGVNNKNSNVESRTKSSTSRSEGRGIKQECNISVLTDHNVTTTSITIRTPASVPGTTLSPITTPVTISYQNATSTDDSSSTTIVTAATYQNHYASSNSRKLILRCGLILKCANFGNELGQSDVELGQSDINPNPECEPPSMHEPSVEHPLVEPPPDEPPYEPPGYFLSSNTTLFLSTLDTLPTTNIKTATRTGNSSSSNRTSLLFKSKIALSSTFMRITTQVPIKLEIALSITTMMASTPPTIPSLTTTVLFSDSLTSTSTVPKDERALLILGGACCFLVLFLNARYRAK